MKKYCKIFIAVFICALLAFSTAACSSETKTDDVTEETSPATSELTTEQNVTEEGTTEETSSAEKDSTADNSTTEKKTTDKTTTKKQSSENSGDYTVQEALEALDNYYGSGYEINGTVSEGNYYYFAVYKNDEKYASVKVNMQNGDAVETLTESGETANLNLFV